MFTFLAYQLSPSLVSGTDVDVPAVPDPTFPLRNNHFYFEEDYKLLGAWAGGPGLTAARLNCPTWNTWNPNDVFPFFASAFSTFGGNQDLRYGVEQAIPKQQELRLTIDVTGGNNGVQDSGFIWIATADHRRDVPKSEYIFKSRWTIPVQGGGGSFWTGPFDMFPQRTLRGGVYSVLGATTATGFSGITLFRLVFPNAPTYHGRVLHPGDRADQNGGDDTGIYQPWQGRYWGEWGRFDTFNPPKMEAFMPSGNGQGVLLTSTLVLTLAYLGEDQALLQSGKKYF